MIRSLLRLDRARIALFLPLVACTAAVGDVGTLEEAKGTAPAPTAALASGGAPAPASTTELRPTFPSPGAASSPQSYAVSNTWPVNADRTVTVPYAIDPAMPTIQQQRVLDAMTYWGATTFIKPKARVSEADYIYFQYDGNPASTVGRSGLGRAGGKQGISIGGNFGGTAHEFGHAMGLIHEQQRPDRDNFVMFNVDPSKNGDLAKSYGGKILGMYDLSSIMHYASDTAGTKSMVSKAGTTIDGGAVLTQGDLYGLNELYFPDASTRGDAFVALAGSNAIAASPYKNTFAPEAKVHDFFCINNEDCLAADVDGNGKDDLITFTKNGPVYVSLSDGSGLPASVMANGYFCVGAEVCATGDVDGDGAQDIVTFQHGATNHAVYVGQSNGIFHTADPKTYPFTFGSQFVLADFCGQNDQCLVGDVTGDGRADLLSVKINGQVWLSTSYQVGWFGFAFNAPVLAGTINRAAFAGVPFTAKLVHFDYYNKALDLALVTSSRGVYMVSTRGSLSAVALSNPTRVADTNAWSRYDFATVSFPHSVVDLLEYRSDGALMVRTPAGGNFSSFPDYWSSVTPACASFTHGCVFGDMNGDGAKDLVRFAR